MVINTSTTIITFLLVFLIQKSENEDMLALQLKLYELVAVHKLASNRLVNVEDIAIEELKVIQKYYSKLSEVTMQQESHCKLILKTRPRHSIKLKYKWKLT